jgi:hypothetical protein
MPTASRNDAQAQAERLRLRRDDLAGLIGEGLLTGAAAREQLQAIADQLQALEGAVDERPFTDEELIDLPTAWEGWTMPQPRAVLRLLFDKITLRHVGPTNGQIFRAASSSSSAGFLTPRPAGTT